MVYNFCKELGMPSVHDYKKLENSMVHRAGGAVATVFHGIIGVLRAVGRFLIRRYTVVFVPHSEKKVYNFHVNVLSMLCFLLVVGGIVGAFFWYGASYNETRVVLAGTDGRLRDVQANLDQLRDETASLLWEARHFESALSGVLATIGPDSGPATQGSADGDLSAFFNVRETPEGMLREVDDVRRLTAYLSNVTEPIREIGAVLGSKSAILSDIPSIWPVAGGLGRITMHFGHNRHPFTGQFYIHNGIDISTGRSGDAVLAAANGQVVSINNDPAGYGNYIIIRHRHGYYTRYAHLLSSRVRLGQRVQQGDVIGHIGNTGMSTGPHLHFEVIIGSDVVDPYQYMRIRSAWRGRR